MNTVKVTFFMVLLTVLLIFIGGLVGGSSGVLFAFAFSLALNFGSYYYSDKIILKMYKAVEVSESDYPEFYKTVRQLADRGSMPMPKVYIISTPSPNAFATGRNPNNAAVAATDSLLSMLNRDEVEAVMAHELAHVYGRDTLISAIAAAFAGAIMMLANFAKFAAIFGGRGRNNSSPIIMLAVAIIAPLAAVIVQTSISRSREFLADQRGASLSGKPLALASALNKLSGRGAVNTRNTTTSSVEPATAHMFIVSPLGSTNNMMGLFSTHPPVEARIERLNAMAKAGDYGRFNEKEII